MQDTCSDTDLKNRWYQLNHRVKEIGYLIDFMKSQEYDLSWLIIMGHSMGGVTALQTARVLGKDVKYCVALDPWLFPIHDELRDFKIEIPFCCISTEKF